MLLLFQKKKSLQLTIYMFCVAVKEILDNFLEKIQFKKTRNFDVFCVCLIETFSFTPKKHVVVLF